MSVEYVESFRSDNIILKDNGAGFNTNLPNPTTMFNHTFHAYPQIMSIIEKQQFPNPLPVQSQLG